MATELVLRTACDRCGAVHEEADRKDVVDYTPPGWEKWQTAERGRTFCPACLDQVHEILAAPLTHVGWASASGSGLSFTGLASTAERDGYVTKVYCFGSAVRRRDRPVGDAERDAAGRPTP